MIHAYMVTGTRPNFPYTKYVTTRSLTNRATVHTPMWTNSFNTQHVRIPIDFSSNFGSNWTSFHSKTKRKPKMETRRSSLRWRKLRPETGDFFSHLIWQLPDYLPSSTHTHYTSVNYYMYVALVSMVAQACHSVVFTVTCKLWPIHYTCVIWGCVWQDLSICCHSVISLPVEVTIICCADKALHMWQCGDPETMFTKYPIGVFITIKILSSSNLFIARMPRGLGLIDQI